ncbi:membrane progestin receptor beta [Lepisosteus oculatus]|uniref:membrane progestin receptor beta n=1 Tax=Lepisosteus oculatus TaxID=7918 RepID=UPI0035F52CD6
MTSATLERFSILSLSAQQLRRLPQLLERCLPAMPSTVKDFDVPRLFREPYILSGYRPVGQEWRFYFLSLFQQHNEALNVWTHLLAALAVLLRFWAFSESNGLLLDVSSLPLYLYILSVLTYLVCSVLAHLLQSHSELAHYSLYFMDYVGVSVYQYGSALVHYFYSSELAWQETFAPLFLPGAALLGWLSCAGCCYAKYRYQRPYPVKRKICQLIPTGLAYLLDISPIAHRLQTCSWSEPAVCLHALQMVFFLLAAFFFSCPVPERFFPGRCDIVGHAHQIFHLFLSLCTLSQLEAIFTDFLGRRDNLLLRYDRGEILVASASFPFLMCCSLLTAAYLRRNVELRLRKKEN